MEHHAQSVDDALIGGLSYKLKEGASYVTNRRSVSYFSQGGNQYTPAGVRVLKFNLTGDQWLDPSTLRVAFTLNNNTAASKKLFNPCHGILRFSSVGRVLSYLGRLRKILMISIGFHRCLLV